MIIRSVTVERLRAINQQRTIEFFPGLNIIKGDNETGKSSLRIAITKALFQDPTTSREGVYELTSWGTDDPWEITLQFDSEESSYQIIKSFKEKSCELAVSGAQQFTAKNKNTISDKISELTGCPTEVFFESTTCIGQDELIRIIPRGTSSADKQSAVGTIAQRLQTKLSGVEGVEIPSILTKLYNQTHRKDAEGPYFHLQKISERLAQLRSQKQEHEKKTNDVIEKRRRFVRINENLDKIYRELPAKLETWEKNKRILELRKEIARDKIQFENFNKAKDLNAQLEKIESDLKPFAAFNNAEMQIEQLKALNSKLDVLSRQRAELRNDIKTFEAQKPGSWAFIAGQVMVAGGLIGLIVYPYSWAAAVIGFLLLAYWFIARLEWKKQKAAPARRLSLLERELRNSENEKNELLRYFSSQTYDEFSNSLTGYRIKMAAKRDIVNQLYTLVAGREWTEYLAENSDLDIHTSARLKELAQIEGFILEPVPLQTLENEVISLQKQKAELEREKSVLDMLFEYTDADKDLLTEIEEELNSLESQKEFWERKRKVYDLTREILEQAYKQTLSKAADLLESETSRYIAMITDGRYNQVKINEDDLSIRTFSPEKNDWIDVSRLSRGTQDQFYICARFALVKLITEGKKPPLLLDDPFVNFHANRLKRTIPLLQEISKENQILLFTCSDAYDYLGKVILID